jgi:hypothetical protein
LGRELFIRVPWPAARTMAVSGSGARVGMAAEPTIPEERLKR